jgi:hypothetical protein
VSFPSADPTTQTAARHQVTVSAHEPGEHPAVELSTLLHDAVADGIVERGDAELIARSRIAGHRVADIAHHRGLGARTLWDRRQRAELALVAAHATN